MELKGKRIVMTGVTGFIGSHVARLLLEEGAEVYGLVRPSSDNKGRLPVHENMHAVYGSLTEAETCLEAAGPADGDRKSTRLNSSHM